MLYSRLRLVFQNLTAFHKHLLLAVLVAANPSGALAGAVEDCNQSADHDRRIRGCGAIIYGEQKGKVSAAYRNRGTAWRAKGEHDLAIANFDQAVRLEPKDGGAYNQRGLSWFDKEDYDRAIADHDRAIQLNPRDDSAYNNRGNAWSKKGDNDRAIADYDRSIRLDAKSAIAYHNRGNAWAEKSDRDRAMADYERAIRLDPNYASAYNSRGNLWYSKGDKERAIADYDRAIHLNPELAVAYNNRGVFWRAKGEIDRAITNYDEAIRLDPKRAALPYRNRGNAWAAKGEKDRAIADYGEAIRLDPTNDTSYLRRASVLADKDDNDRAIADYDRVIRLNPKDSLAYLLRGDAWIAKGDFDRAIASFSELIALDPKEAPGYAYRGKAYRMKGDFARAIVEYNDSIQLKSKAGDYRGRGTTWYEAGDLDRAIADLNEAIKISPTDIEAHRTRGRIHFARGDFAAALPDFKRASDLRDRYSMLWRFFIQARLKQDGRPELSVYSFMTESQQWPNPILEFYLGKRPLDQLQAAADTADKICEVNFYSAQLHVAQGQPLMAKPLLEAAVAGCPKNFIEYDGATTELKRLGHSSNSRAQAVDKYHVEQLQIAIGKNYRSRGQAQFILGDWAAAFNDFKQGSELGDAYAMLWRFFTQARLIEDGSMDLATYSLSAGMNWPYPVIQYYLSSLPLEQLRSAADTPQKNCEMNFYLAEWHISRGEKAAAVPLLDAAVRGCDQSQPEQFAAAVERTRMAP